MFRLYLAAGFVAAVAAGPVGAVADLPAWTGLVLAIVLGAGLGLWVRSRRRRGSEQ